MYMCSLHTGNRTHVFHILFLTSMDHNAKVLGSRQYVAKGMYSYFGFFLRIKNIRVCRHTKEKGLNLKAYAVQIPCSTDMIKILYCCGLRTCRSYFFYRHVNWNFIFLFVVFVIELSECAYSVCTQYLGTTRMISSKLFPLVLIMVIHASTIYIFSWW